MEQIRNQLECLSFCHNKLLWILNKDLAPPYFISFYFIFAFIFFVILLLFLVSYYRAIGLMSRSRVFANGPGDRGSILGWIIPKTKKMVLDAALLNTQYYKVRIKGKVEQSREGVVPSPTPWCSSYWKGSLRVTLE